MQDLGFKVWVLPLGCAAVRDLVSSGRLEGVWVSGVEEFGVEGME